MIPLIADGSWSVKDLQRYREPVEIRTPDGQLIGTFVPAHSIVVREANEGTDSAELERRAQSQSPGYGIEQIRKILRDEDSVRAFLAGVRPSGGDGCPTP